MTKVTKPQVSDWDARRLKAMVPVQNPRATIQELRLLLECFIREDFGPMKATRLFQLHSGEYCEYLSILSEAE